MSTFSKHNVTFLKIYSFIQSVLILILIQYFLLFSLLICFGGSVTHPEVFCIEELLGFYLFICLFTLTVKFFSTSSSFESQEWISESLWCLRIRCAVYYVVFEVDVFVRFDGVLFTALLFCVSLRMLACCLVTEVVHVLAQWQYMNLSNRMKTTAYYHLNCLLHTSPAFRL